MGGGDLPESCPVEAKSIYLPPNWRGTMGPATGPPNAWRCAAAVAMVLLGLTSLLSISPETSAAGPTLTIVSPTDRAIIGNGSPVYVVYEVSSFNLTPPGGGPDPNGGHTLIFVDGALTLETAAQTVPLNLPSGGHVIELRLVSTDGSDSVTFRIQFAPIVDINPYLSVIQIILAAAILIVLFYRDWGRSILDRLVARIRGRNA